MSPAPPPPPALCPLSRLSRSTPPLLPPPSASVPSTPKYRNAYTETFNFNVQQALPYSVAISAGYYGSVGKHLRQGVNINEILPTTGARSFLKLAATSPVDPGASINANITQAKGNGISNYNGFWFTANKITGPRPAGHLQLAVHQVHGRGLTRRRPVH